jgi:thioredoxin-related protein
MKYLIFSNKNCLISKTYLESLDEYNIEYLYMNTKFRKVNQLAQKYGVKTIPTTIITDDSLELIDRKVGPVDPYYFLALNQFTSNQNP